MIQVPRSVLKRFRQLCRRGGLHKFRRDGNGPSVTVSGGSEGCRIRAVSPDVAIEYRAPAPSDPVTLHLPLDAFEACEGRDDAPVTIENHTGNRVLLSWTDRGVPRLHEAEQLKSGKLAFPEPPINFAANEPGLWSTLRYAVSTTDTQYSRYALGCLHLRGKFSQIEATDGKQVFVQRAVHFGFQEDVLVPGSKVLGCADLDLGRPVNVGRAGEWVAFNVDCWTILLPIQKDARFPKIDDILPNPTTAKSQLELTVDDAEFLAEMIPRLPCHDETHGPITLDLNGQVLVRACEQEKGRPTEVVLTSSKMTGDAVLLNTDRRYVERALKLGFRHLYLNGPDSPVQCVADDRRYLWAVLGKDSAIKRSDDAIRIESSAASPPPVIHRHKENAMSASDPATTPAAPKVAKRTQVEPSKNVGGSPIEQTLVLRDALRNAARQANDLLRSLKRQKRQTRIVESTLASLKQLQKVAG